VYIRARVRSGTSGRFRVVCRNEIAATESILGGVFATPTVFAGAAGTITDVVNKLLPNGDREFTFTLTPNATSANVSFGIGPDSDTSGMTIDIIGMQATSQFSEWIMGGVGTVAQAADVATLDLTGVSMAAGFMLRMDGTVLGAGFSTYSRFFQADNGTQDSTNVAIINLSNSQWQVQQKTATVLQSNIVLGALLPLPAVFSIVGAYAQDYVGGSRNGIVATPDITSDFATPNRLHIGSNVGGENLPLTLTRITLYPETPTTPRVTAVSA
jgi:hypothetical protein